MRLPYTVEGRKPYRPSNGTEGMAFMAEFCDRCAKEPGWDNDGNSKGTPCEILSATFLFNPGDPEYPPEWIEEGDEAKCTAFEEVRDGD